jgi:hypothetical protein
MLLLYLLCFQTVENVLICFIFMKFRCEVSTEFLSFKLLSESRFSDKKFKNFKS